MIVWRCLNLPSLVSRKNDCNAMALHSHRQWELDSGVRFLVAHRANIEALELFTGIGSLPEWGLPT